METLISSIPRVSRVLAFEKRKDDNLVREHSGINWWTMLTYADCFSDLMVNGQAAWFVLWIVWADGPNLGGPWAGG